jgi:2-keto-4-pentenoate hydratase
MKKMDIERAAAVLVNARRTRTHLQGLPDGLKPTTVDEAYAIQAAVTRQLGKLIAGFKAIVPPGEGPTIAMLYGGTIHASPATMPVRDVPHCGVEAEVAFRFNRDFPARATPYSLDEVAAGMDCCAAIEVVSGRFDLKAQIPNLERLADGILNGGFVHGDLKSDWRGLDLGKQRVTLAVNGQTIVDQEGGHATGDPLGVAVALVNAWTPHGGVRKGQFATCGSFTGLRYINPGDVCTISFAGLGSARVEFAV